MRSGRDRPLLDLTDLLPLAHGVLESEHASELEELKEQIRRDAGFYCSSYKENCFRRRVAVRMRARGVKRYSDYARILEREPAEYEKLLTTVTINVSRFFRNNDVWDVVKRRVLPELLELDSPYLNVWSSATAAGEEAFTLAIMIRQMAEEDPARDTSRFRLVGTDIDPEALEAARLARYDALALAETPDPIRDRWFEAGPPYRPIEEIRRMVRFWKMDLIADHFPRSQHLIACRNVIIYFEREVQQRLLDRFHQALSPGGFLILGKVETLLGELAGRWETVSAPARVYRRI